MSRPLYYGERTARWVGLSLFILAMPLFLRATSILPGAPDAMQADVQETSAVAVQTPEAFPPVQTLPPEEARVLSGLDVTETEPPQAEFPQTEPPQMQEADILFVEGNAQETAGAALSPKGGAGTSAPATPAPAEEGVWRYEGEDITVDIQRHTQDDFVYFAADIQLTRPSQFAYAFSHEKYGASTESLSDMAERHAPVLAINGDYYSFHDNGIIIRGGELFRKQNSKRHLLIVEADGDLSVMTDRTEKQGVVAGRLMDEGVLHTFEFGPVLVLGGQAVRLNSKILRTAEGYVEPRTAIGQIGPLHYLVLIVDGRSPGYSSGCDLPTLQQLFMDYGVETAFNLDGGGSTTLWFDGEVINQPAAGDERKVSDIVMFMAE